MQGGVKTPANRIGYKRVTVSDFGRPRNPSRPAPPPAQITHTSLWAITASSTHNSPCSWAEHQGGIITTKPKPAAKASNHGHLNKIKSTKKQAKHQGGAGQARRGARWWHGDDGVKASSSIHGNGDRKLLCQVDVGIYSEWPASWKPKRRFDEYSSRWCPLAAWCSNKGAVNDILLARLQPVATWNLHTK
jgi:hypothetical protein